MKKCLLAALIFMASATTLTAQQAEQAEKAAMQCLTQQFAQQGVTIQTLLAAVDNYKRFAAANDITRFDAQKAHVDSILTACGFYTDSLSYTTWLLSCLSSGYSTLAAAHDTTSSYYLTTSHLMYLQNNPWVLKELSPALQLEAARSTVLDIDTQKDIYKLYSLLMFHAVSRQAAKHKPTNQH